MPWISNRAITFIEFSHKPRTHEKRPRDASVTWFHLTDWVCCCVEGILPCVCADLTDASGFQLQFSLHTYVWSWNSGASSRKLTSRGWSRNDQSQTWSHEMIWTVEVTEFIKCCLRITDILVSVSEVKKNLDQWVSSRGFIKILFVKSPFDWSKIRINADMIINW